MAGKPSKKSGGQAPADKPRYSGFREWLNGNRGNPGEIDKVISRGKGRRELKMQNKKASAEKKLKALIIHLSLVLLLAGLRSIS